MSEKDENAEVAGRGAGVGSAGSQEVWYPSLTRSWKRPSSGEEAARGVGRGLEGSWAAETQGSAEGGAVCAEEEAGSPGPSSGKGGGMGPESSKAASSRGDCMAVRRWR